MSNKLGLNEYNEYVNRTMSIDNDNPNFLFVCEGNAQRSPTLDLWFVKNRPQYNVRSAGTAFSYNHPLNEELLEWSDIIWVCDLEQSRFIHRRFNEFHHKVEIIGISDQYTRESPQLYRIIEFWVERRGL
jgi:predicted protein tyrosine phosphatase